MFNFSTFLGSFGAWQSKRQASLQYTITGSDIRDIFEIVADTTA